jgi:tRNA dimethylallyltransferase
MQPRIWLIAGPTASGKSALALRVAETFGGEIINADSMQIYRNLRILTARPAIEPAPSVPHHLFGVVDASQGCSTGLWLDWARNAVSEITKRSRIAILVGGTGLYLSALTKGLAAAPAISSDVRQATEREWVDLGEEAFRRRLAEIDPAAAQRISPGDRQRLVRAWGVYAATGRSISSHQSATSGGLSPDAWRGVALVPPRAELYARCDARLEMMLATGALDEVAALMARDLDPALPILKAVGYREFAAHLRGEASLGEALAAARQSTRNYAKRQLTWIRGQMTDWPRIETLDPEDQWRQFLALNPDLTA